MGFTRTQPERRERVAGFGGRALGICGAAGEELGHSPGPQCLGSPLFVAGVGIARHRTVEDATGTVEVAGLLREVALDDEQRRLRTIVTQLMGQGHRLEGVFFGADRVSSQRARPRPPDEQGETDRTRIGTREREALCAQTLDGRE